ncbi:DUF2853 family protein [Phenylobacterium sp. Root700]|uniref:DUF2853 family protein n=1 Tax=Phenylobacterium sp. Root700 TaxID=1736591 RepID=UPI0009EB2EA2|nr:DUF2853 family protein [Phenylobacterium sp. Root700]
MAEDWYADVKKYAPNADTNVVAAIVRYCGIALQNRDSSLVAFTDEVEVGRVRENFLKKKLGLTDSDADLNQAIAAVGVKMKQDPTRNRVTVYYLLAEHFKKLGLFGGADVVEGPGAAPLAAVGAAAAGVGAAAGTGAGAAAKASAPLAAAGAGLDAAATGAGAAATQAFAGGAAAAPVAKSGLMRWLPWLLLAGLLLLLWWFFANRQPAAPAMDTAQTTAPAVAAAPAATPETPAVTAAAPGAPVAVAVVGLPANVYFDVGSFAPGDEGGKTIATAAGAITASAAKIAITAYTDKTGDLTKNQELAKNRAKAVRDALMAAGVPQASIEMRPPLSVEIGAAGTSDAQSRRVEITSQ